MWSFTFKGESSRDYGITVNRRAPRQTANTRTVLTEIDGRDGAVIEKVGYNTYTMNMQITVQGKDNLHRISSWLKGEGKFTRSDIEGRYLLVKHESEIEFTMISNNLYTSQITFQVMYPKWLKEDSWSRPWGANLIPNGWDSFNVYGGDVEPAFVDTSGFKQFGKNTPEAIIVDSGKWEVIAPDTRATTHAYLEKAAREDIIRFNEKTVTVLLEVEALSLKDQNKFSFYVNNGYVWPNDSIKLGRHFYKIEYKMGSNTNPVLHFSQPAESHVVVHSVVIYDDTCKPHLRKTPLDNGLTRIQTWGGNDRLKIRNVGAFKSNHIFSAYIENNGDTFSIGDGWSFVSNTGNLDKGDKSFVTFKYDSRGTDTRVAAREVHYNLDFIASDPQIVEGDTPPTWEADENPRIVNEGNTSSQPIIKIIKNKEETLDVVINGTRLIYEFDNSKYIDIDCYTQEVTDDQGLSKARNLKIGYEFPELKPGDNVVQVLEGDATILFRRKDAWK